ncbi:MAG: 2-isopropylmalate synthase [Candidatus Sumerlaeia bacterium]|nr:2-isopropylmalate synthase [Candidatus Sumerlaeia bacterium]
MNTGNHVVIFDTTLRDGEQAPGCSMTLKEKLEVGRQLARLGVDVIEAGFPISSIGDFESVRAIAEKIGNMDTGPCKKPPTIAGLCRSREKDIARAAEAVKPARFPRIHTFIATSPIHRDRKLRMSREQVVESAVNAVKYAKTFVDDVEFSLEDAGRTEWDFMVEVVAAVIDAGATTVNIPDTVGYCQPDQYAAQIRHIFENVPKAKEAIISVHCHNDLGLAVANSLAAVKQGARQIECTINGLGERAGNASLEEIVMNLRTRSDYFGCDTVIASEELFNTSRLVSQVTGQRVQANKAIVGANAFAHEAGIHQDGMLKDKSTYEIMTPESVGWRGEGLVMGKHSGRHAFRDRLAELGFELDGDDFERCFTRFKEVADKKKDVYDDDLVALAQEALFQNKTDSWVFEYMSAMTGTTISPTATVRLSYEGRVYTDAAMGDGPVDAVFAAIDRITANPLKVLEYQIEAVTEGQDAMGRVTLTVTRADCPGKNRVKGRGVATDIIQASAKAYIAALNALDRLEKLQAQRGETNTSEEVPLNVP